MTKKLSIRQGEQYVTTYLDDEDYDRLHNHTWYVDKDGYVKRHANVADLQEFGTPTSIQIGLAREVLGLPHVCGRSGVDRAYADHIDGNPANNTRANLRIVTQRQNKQNSGNYNGRMGRSSTYRGVTKRGNKKGGATWCARAKWDDQDHYLGCFPTEIEAAYVAQQARLAHMTHNNEERHIISKDELEAAQAATRANKLAKLAERYVADVRAVEAVTGIEPIESTREYINGGSIVQLPSGHWMTTDADGIKVGHLTKHRQSAVDKLHGLAA